MRLFLWRKRTPPGTALAAGPAGLAAGSTAVFTHRQFLKLLAGAVGGLGLLGSARQVEATYIPATPPATMDIVDTNLTVQGNLIVTSGPNGPGNVGIGTASPQGKLDVAGTICVNGLPAVGSDRVAKQCYYSFTTGAWAIVGQYTWGECLSNNWTWQDLTTLTP